MSKKRLKEVLQHKIEIIRYQTELVNQLKEDLGNANAELKRLRADLAFAEYRVREAPSANTQE